MLKHVITIGWTSICLSVCPSVTRWYCIKTAEHIVMLSSPHDSSISFILVSRNSDRVTPCGAAKQRWGMKMSQFSTNTRHRYIAISQKWFKIDGYIQWGILQALNPRSFHPCYIYRDCPKGVPRGGQNVQKNVLKWRTFELPGWITGKLLKIDGYEVARWLTGRASD